MEESTKSWTWKILLTIIALLLILISFIWPERGWSARVERDLVLLYDFTETKGTAIYDKVELYPVVDCVIQDASKVEWLNPGLRIKEGTLAKSSSDLTKLNKDAFFDKGITIEVWIKPLDNTQSGPARIVTWSQDSGNRNFTLGQAKHYYQQRFRTSQTNSNGSDIALQTPATSIADPTVLQHIVYTRSETGLATFYIDGGKVQAMEIPGSNSTWNTGYAFGLFNETNYPTDVRTWLGDIFLVGIYADDLTEAEVKQNYDAGVPESIEAWTITFAWDANSEPDLAGYKIYYGKTSRYDPSHPNPEEKAKALAEEKCKSITDKLSTRYKECYDSWAYDCVCKKWGESPDPKVCLDIDSEGDWLCDPQVYKYEDVVDVKNVTEYTLKVPTEGKYYFAATAYDEDNNESIFSEELDHTKDTVAPGSPVKIKVEEKIEPSK
jgi:hypothetical protein